MKTGLVFCCIGSLLSLGTLLGETAVDFSGDAYPGSEGAGWASPWMVRRARAEFEEVKVADALRLSPDTPNHLQITARSTPDGSGEGAGGALVRAYGASPGGVNLEQPVRYRFVFRADSVSPESRYTIYESNKPQANSGGNATWQIAALGGTWRVKNGSGNGGAQSEVDTGIPLEEGVSYSFLVTADPVSRTWRVDISRDGSTHSFKDLNFRTTENHLGGNLHFGFSDSQPNTGTAFQYSVGDVEISPAR